MATLANTLQVEGSFEDVATELAQYIDNLKNKLSGEPGNTAAEIAPMLESQAKDDALKALVVSSTTLNAAPERGMRRKERILPAHLRSRGLTVGLTPL